MSTGPEEPQAGPDQRTERSAGVLDDAYQQLRTFRRVRQGRVIAGVCTGVGHRLGIDPVVVRIGLAVLTLMNGVGALLYLAAWVLFPDQDSDESIADRLFGRSAPGERRGAVIVGVVAILALAGSGMMPMGDGFWGPILLVLIVVGVVAMLRRQPGSGDPSQPAVTTDPDATGAQAATPSTESSPVADLAGEAKAPAAGAPQAEPAEPRTWTQHAATSQPSSFWEQPDPLGLEVDDEPALDPAPPPPPPPRRRQPSKLVPATAMVALLVLGFMIALDNAAGMTIPVGAYFAVALGITGLGLVIGTWFGRPRGLIAVGVLLSLALVPASVLGGIGGWPGITTTDSGTYAYQPMSVDQMRPEYAHSFGTMTIDLTEVDFADSEPVDLSARLDAGELVIVVPPEVDVTLMSSVGFGDVSALGRQHDAPSGDLDITDLGDDGRGGGQLTITADIGLGELEVRRG